MGAPRTSPKVLEALTQRRGRDVGISELMTATGLDDKQIRSAIRSLIDRDKQPITTVQRGNMWRLENPVARPALKVVRDKDVDTEFERIGVTSGGDVIVKGNRTDVLYKLTEL